MKPLSPSERSKVIEGTTEALLARRRFLLGSALALTGCGTASPSTTTPNDASVGSDVPRPDVSVPTDAVATDAGTPSPNALWIPPLLTGTTFDLSLAPSSRQFLPGAPTPTYAFNGEAFWGPTMVFNKGDTVHLNVTNRLSEETTTHWHGFHIPPYTDGGPHQNIPAGTTWRPSFEVMNDAGTYWYHPHLHTTTMAQLSMGAGGLIIIRDPIESALALPRTYGVDDIPLVLTSRTFQPTNAINTGTIYGDRMLSNGVLDAVATLPAQMVRFRVLNAEMERAYTLGFADNRTFHVIASDGGLLSAPVALTRLMMAPGERYEIVVNLSADAVGSTVVIQSFNGGHPLGYPGGEPGTSGMFGSQLNNRTFDVLRIQVAPRTASAILMLPTTLRTITPLTSAQATQRRRVAITDHGPGSPFQFDGRSYDHNRIDQMVQLGAVEEWTIANGMVFGHSFHIHDVQFSIVSRSSGPVPPQERGWKDTFFIDRNESVTFVARFADFASIDSPFMYHCHMSNHEDEGLMGQFLVVP